LFSLQHEGKGPFVRLCSVTEKALQSSFRRSMVELQIVIGPTVEPD